MKLTYLIVASLLILVSCSSNSDRSTNEEAGAVATTADIYELTTEQFQSSNLTLGTLETTTFHAVVKAIGIIDVPPANIAAVSSYFGGTVKDIQLLPGEYVKKGQRLFILENPDYVQMQQEYLEAKGQLSYLKSDYERQKNLAQDNVTSQKNFLKAESDYTVTSVKAESLGKKLTLMNINPNTLTVDNIRTTISVPSPISGYVTKVGISRGSFLNPSQTAVTIVDTDHMHLELSIFEKDLPSIQKGQTIKFRIQEDDNEEYDASVYLVNRTVDIEKRNIGIHGHLTDEKLAGRLNPGMYVEADIYTTTESKISLPAEAVVEIESRYYVLVLQNSSDAGYTFLKKEVKTGLSNNDNIEILNHEEFPKNSQFLTKGAFNLITE